MGNEDKELAGPPMPSIHDRKSPIFRALREVTRTWLVCMEGRGEHPTPFSDRDVKLLFDTVTKAASAPIEPMSLVSVPSHTREQHE